MDINSVYRPPKPYRLIHEMGNELASGQIHDMLIALTAIKQYGGNLDKLYIARPDGQETPASQWFESNK